MSEKKLQQIKQELGIKPPALLDQWFLEKTQGTMWENAAQTPNAAFFNIYKNLMRDLYDQFYQIAEKMIPNRFYRYSEGEWLQQQLLDLGGELFFGQKAVYELTATKPSGLPIKVKAGELFFIREPNPKRTYVAIDNYEFPAGTTDCVFSVEAQEVGVRYHCSAGVIQESQVNYGFEKLENLSHEPIQLGKDADDEEKRREQIFSILGISQNHSTKEAYENVLKSIGGIDHAVLDDVNDQGVHYFTIYGKGINHDDENDPIVVAAKRKLDEYMRAVDRYDLSVATAFDLSLQISVDANFKPAEKRQIQASAERFVSQMPIQDFHESYLYSWLYQDPTLQNFIFNKSIQISPDFVALPEQQYFVANITINRS